MIRASKALGYPVVHGEVRTLFSPSGERTCKLTASVLTPLQGKNITSYVNVLDLAEGYAIILVSV